MRKFLLILILTLSIQLPVKSENIEIDNLFGVKILDNIQMYSKVENGKKLDYLPGIITFDDDVINIERNENFDDYYLRTDLKYKIQNITAKRTFIDLESPYGSIDMCKKDKINTVKLFSKLFNIDFDKFKNGYWIDPRQKSLFEDSTIVYENNGLSFELSTYCGYFQYEDSVLSILFVSWVTDTYFKNHVEGRWKKIDKFDKEFIKLYYAQDT